MKKENDGEQTLAALLALESVRAHPTMNGDDQLLQILADSGGPVIGLKHDDTVDSFRRWTPDGSGIVSFSKGKGQLWNVHSGRILGPVPEGGGSGFSFAPKIGRAAWGNEKGEILIWDIPSGQIIVRLPENPGEDWPRAHIRWSPDARFLAVWYTPVEIHPTDPGWIDVWDLHNGKSPLRGVRYPRQRLRDAEWSRTENGLRSARITRVPRFGM